jgi:hypothetical protein
MTRRLRPCATVIEATVIARSPGLVARSSRNERSIFSESLARFAHAPGNRGLVEVGELVGRAVEHAETPERLEPADLVRRTS